jgi:hypothetical protein
MPVVETTTTTTTTKITTTTTTVGSFSSSTLLDDGLLCLCALLHQQLREPLRMSGTLFGRRSASEEAFARSHLYEPSSLRRTVSWSAIPQA